jgi:hypothetical protein
MGDTYFVVPKESTPFGRGSKSVTRVSSAVQVREGGH